MTTSVSVASDLPQEILIEILSAFRNRRAVLKTCGLVSKPWLYASRVILFRSINLTPLLAQRDWLSVFLNMPLNIGDHVREIIITNARWTNKSSSTRVLLLSHFATSVTSLRLSNLTISDFADFTNIVSILKGLQMLSMQHVGFEHNTLDFSDSIPPNRSFPTSITSIYFYHADLGLVFGWILAHTIVPKLSQVYFGPLDCGWKAKAHQYFYHNIANLTEAGFLFGASTATPYSNYCSTLVPRDGSLPVPPSGLQFLVDSYQARYGVELGPAGFDFAENIRILRIHRFFYGKGQGMAVRTVWAARVLVNVTEGFRGRVVLDVEVLSVREINGLEVDWEFLEDIFSAEAFGGMEALVFLVLTNISLATLESLIALKLPKLYAKGILRFEEASEATIRPIDIL